MRILQLITDTDRRGAQVFAVDLGDALRRRNHEIDTVAMTPGRSASRIDVETLGDSRRAPGLYTALARRARGYDVVAAHGSSTLVSCALSVWGVPFVYRQISDPVFWAGHWSRRLRVAAYLRRSRHVVALSATTRRQLGELFAVPTAKITVIPNGIDPARIGSRSDAAERRTDADPLRLITVNALVSEKGTDLVIEAVSRLPDAHLTVIGDGPDRAELEESAARDAGGRVTFVGQVQDVGPYFDDADVVVLASRGGDSMPATLIEAGFRAIPAISTDVGSISEVVIDRRTGLIVDLDQPLALDGAIAEMADPDLRHRLGDSARRHCQEQFHIDVVAEAWEQALRTASAGRRG